MAPLCLDVPAACKWLGTFSKIKWNDSQKEKRTELRSGIKRSSSRRPEGSLSCSFSLPFSAVVISCVTSARRRGNKGSVSCPITSVKSERQADLHLQNKHFRPSLFTWRAKPASCCRVGWQRVRVQCLRKREAEIEPVLLTEFSWKKQLIICVAV